MLEKRSKFNYFSLFRITGSQKWKKFWGGGAGSLSKNVGQIA